MARHPILLRTFQTLPLLLSFALVLAAADEPTPPATPPATPPIEAPAPTAPVAETPAPAPAETPAPAAPAPDGGVVSNFLGIPEYPIHGDLSLKYRVRWTSDDSDQDLYQYFNLSVGDPRSNTVTSYLAMRSTLDIDGRSGVTGFYTFDSLADTYNHNYNAQLYAAYLDVNHMGLIDLFRIGRQVMTDLPVTLQFDGARLDTWKFDQLKRLQFSFFGGLPVHLYEGNSHGDSLYGALAKCEPWQGARLQADWTHLEDRYLLLDRVNDLYGIGLWQRFLNDFQFYGRYNRLNTRGRDVEARLLYNSQPWQFNVNASWYALVEKQNALAIDIDPFTQVLLTQFPYWQARLTAQKSLGEFFDLLVGGTVRQLFDPADISPYNREFASAFATVSTANWPVKGFEAALTGELWDAHQTEGTTQTISGDIGYRYRREVAENRYQDVCLIQLGTTYSLYKYDFFLNQEVQRTRTWYAKVWWKPATWLRWDARFAHESSDFGEYSDLSSSLRLQF